MYVRFYDQEMNIKEDILVFFKQKVKKAVSHFMSPSFHYFFANIHITHKSRELFLLAIR